MGWPSYVDSIDAIQCDLLHLAGFAARPAELDVGKARVILDKAELLLGSLGEAREIATDPRLDVADEVVRLQVLAVKFQKQRRADQERIESLRRVADARANDTMYWRDEYYKLSRQLAAIRRRSRRRR